jgi:predicted MFS family arabinose efflux permease
VIIAIAFGTVAAFAMPVRSSLVPVLVGRERVMQAVVLMTIGANVAMIAGPLLVGGVIDGFGVGWAFAVQALCFALGFLAATRIEVPPHPPVAERRRLRAEVGEAVSFVWRHEVLRPLFGLLCVGGGLMGGGAFTLLPQIARDEFGRSAAEAARLFALMGLGMIITSLVLMRVRSRLRRRGLVFMSFMVLGCSNQVVQGQVSTFFALEVLLLVWGLTGGFYMNLNQSLIQELTPADRMGRVMALNSLVQAGLLPLGGLVAGLLATAIGAPATLSLFGLAGLLCVLTALVRAHALRAIS